MYEKYKYLRDIYNQSYIVINQRDINAQNSFKLFDLKFLEK